MRDRPLVRRDGPLICSVVPLKPCILQTRGERETSSKHDRQDGGEIRLRCAAAVALLCPREGSGINVEMIRGCQKVGIFTYIIYNDSGAISSFSKAQVIFSVREKSL